MNIPKNFPPMVNDDILKVARGETASRIPVWIMRQAGRYLPEFLELRKKHDFFEIVKNPELSMEVTLMPIKRFDLDAAIIFSDILVIPQAVGMEVKMEPGVGPVIPDPVRVPSDIATKCDFNVDVREKMKGTLDAITLTRHTLNGKVPLIGFSGAPWTLMSYMIEGGGSRTLSKSKLWLYKYPEESSQFLSLLTTLIVDYLVEQIAHGAQMLQVFESHAELLSPDLFSKFCLPFLKQILVEVKDKAKIRGLEPVPMIIFPKGGHYCLKEVSEIGYDVVGIDWTVDPVTARANVAENTILQGNMDPCALYGSEKSVPFAVKKMIDGMGPKNYIANLGHGIYPDSPIDGVISFIKEVHSYKK